MKFIINGGNKLNGTVKIGGAKNAATKMMVASLLSKDPTTLSNFPFIGDTKITTELCKIFGSKIIENKDKNVIKIHTPEITNYKATSLARRNRIPILSAGPLLARYGKVIIPTSGGDKIGPRPVDLHIMALRSLGAKVNVYKDYIYAEAPNKLKGAHIKFPFPSVGATENAIMASVLAEGKTTIENTATEPEIIDLIKMLQKMGAIIELGANRKIYVEGVKSLNGTHHKIVADRNEAISFAVLGIANGGTISLKGVEQENLLTFLNVIRKIGANFKVYENKITLLGNKKFKPINITTDTHPGFMTDWQQPLAVLLTQANGTSVIHETIYEDRFGYTDDLNIMGANIKKTRKCIGEKCRFYNKRYYHSAKIYGPTNLHGANIKVRDLRSGMAHVIAALIANGQSVIDGIEEIDRGYRDLDITLRSLGANIKRVK